MRFGRTETSGRRALCAFYAVGALALAVLLAGCGRTPLFGRWAPSFGELFWARSQDPARPLPSVVLPLLIADFNHSGHQTNTGHPFGAWDSDPGDPTQYCRVRLVENERIGQTGFSLMLEYDVDSPNPAYNGFWMKLPQVRLRRYGALSFDIKGDRAKGYTHRLVLELKGNSQVARYTLGGISDEWQRVRLPLWDFENVESVREASEFVIVLEDQDVTQRVGTLYLENIRFEP